MKYFSPTGVALVRGICQRIDSALEVHIFDKGDKQYVSNNY